MNDREFRERAWRVIVWLRTQTIGPDAPHAELSALFFAGAEHETCDCAYPPAHRPECPVVRHAPFPFGSTTPNAMRGNVPPGENGMPR